MIIALAILFLLIWSLLIWQLAQRSSLHREQQAQGVTLGRFRLILETLPALISYLDRDQRFRFANRTYAEWFEVESDALLGQSLSEFYGAQTYEQIRPQIERALAGETVRYTRELIGRNKRRWVEVLAVPDRDSRGAVQGLCVMMSDITDRVLAEQALQASEQRLRTIADNLPVLISYVDRDCRYQFCNATYFAWWGIPIEELIGRHVRQALGDALYLEREPFLLRALQGERVEFELASVTNGTTRYTRTTYIPDRDALEQVVGVYIISMDVTTLKLTELELMQLAQFDGLTGLPNRHNFSARLGEALIRNRSADSSMALLFLDLDDFKGINDSLGHGVGDEVLRIFATRVADAVRPSDMVARLGGDEFVVILEGLHSAQDAQRIAQSIRRAVRVPMVLSDSIDAGLVSTTSIGVAFVEHRETTAAELMRRADAALYAAKTAGRDTVCLAD